MPLSLQLALPSCSGAGFSGEGLPLDSQCIGGENICRGAKETALIQANSTLSPEQQCAKREIINKCKN